MSYPQILRKDAKCLHIDENKFLIETVFLPPKIRKKKKEKCAKPDLHNRPEGYSLWMSFIFTSFVFFYV